MRPGLLRQDKPPARCAIFPRQRFDLMLTVLDAEVQVERRNVFFDEPARRHSLTDDASEGWLTMTLIRFGGQVNYAV